MWSLTSLLGKHIDSRSDGHRKRRLEDTAYLVRAGQRISKRLTSLDYFPGIPEEAREYALQMLKIAVADKHKGLHPISGTNQALINLGFAGEIARAFHDVAFGYATVAKHFPEWIDMNPVSLAAAYGTFKSSVERVDACRFPRDTVNSNQKQLLEDLMETSPTSLSFNGRDGGRHSRSVHPGSEYS